MLKIYNNCSDDNPTNKLPKQTPPSGVLIMEQQGGLRPPCKCQTFTYINFFKQNNNTTVPIVYWVFMGLS